MENDWLVWVFPICYCTIIGFVTIGVLIEVGIALYKCCKEDL